MSLTIHNTAVVSSKATIGTNCFIGPFCHIGNHVILGEGCRLHSHVVLDGHLTVGENCHFYPFSCVGTQTQDLKYQGEISRVEIGDGNTIREYVTINAATSGKNKTVVGNHCLIQSYCHIAHECILADHVIMSSGAMLSGHVEIHSHAVVAGYVGVVQFVRIGTMAMVGGYSKLSQDVLPYCIVEGIPAETRSINKIGMERNGLSAEAIKIVSSAHKQIMRSGMPLEKVIPALEKQFSTSQEVAKMLDFIAHSTRGLARPKRHLENKS